MLNTGINTNKTNKFTLVPSENEFRIRQPLSSLNMDNLELHMLGFIYMSSFLVYDLYSGQYNKCLISDVCL